jgi:hypothetical protein
MGYNTELADRLRAMLAGRKGYSEKKMFGGLSFMINGKICVWILGDDLALRARAGRNEEAIAPLHARPMYFAGKPMKGFVCIGPGDWQKDAVLTKCVEMSIDCVSPAAAGKKSAAAQSKKNRMKERRS